MSVSYSFRKNSTLYSVEPGSRLPQRTSCSPEVVNSFSIIGVSTRTLAIKLVKTMSMPGCQGVLRVNVDDFKILLQLNLSFKMKIRK